MATCLEFNGYLYFVLTHRTCEQLSCVWQTVPLINCCLLLRLQLHSYPDSLAARVRAMLMHSSSALIYVHFVFKNFYFYFILLYNTALVLPYIDMNPPQVYMSSQSWTPLPSPTPYHLSGSSPCTSPKHPVSCIEYRLAIRFLRDSIHVSMPFSQIIPPSPSPSESKSPFYTSVSLLLAHIQGHHYHLSKFHIYVSVYYIGVFLSGLLHSV